MKRLISIIAIIIAGIVNVNAQEYIKKDKVIDGLRTVEASPATFINENEIYLLSWNYLGSPADNVDHYYLSLYCSQDKDTWSISAGDKLYLGLALEDEYIELTALTDAQPEAIDDTKHSILAHYLIPKEAYDKLYKGIDRLKIIARENNTSPVILNVKLPFSAIEHMLMSYLDIMIATGR